MLAESFLAEYKFKLKLHGRNEKKKKKDKNYRENAQFAPRFLTFHRIESPRFSSR